MCVFISNDLKILNFYFQINIINIKFYDSSLKTDKQSKMNIELEPHSYLIEYYNITSTFKSDLTIDVFTNAGENYNILSDINENIFLLKKLDELNLLNEHNHICDCGIGLGNTLFEIYLQSTELDKIFSFTGIEKQKVYIDFINKELIHLWKDGLYLIQDDIMNLDYSNYNIVYSYSPFNNFKQLKSMYNKIVSDIKSDSIIIEHANRGLGHFNLLEEIEGLEKIKLDYTFVFKKL